MLILVLMLQGCCYCRGDADTDAVAAGVNAVTGAVMQGCCCCCKGDAVTGAAVTATVC